MLFPKQGTKNTLKLQNPAAAELNHKPFCPKVIFRSQPDHSYIPIHFFLQQYEQFLQVALVLSKFWQIACI